MLNGIITQETLSKEEIASITDIFSSPLVKKYLRIMGQNDLAELAVLSVSERDDSEVAKKHALVQGKLSTLVTLLSIIKPPVKE
jgi:hypothetical protein